MCQINEQSNWELIQRETNKLIKDRQFEKAFQSANQAKLIAEKLNDTLLLARSWHLIGKTQMSLGPNNKIAIDSFLKSINYFGKTEKTLQTRKWAGYMINDLAFVYTDPQYTHTPDDLKAAMVFLFNVFQSNVKYETQDKKELEVLTAINISNCFYHFGHLTAQLIFLEYARDIYNQFSSSINKYYFYLINLRLQKVYRRLGEYEKAFNCLQSIAKFLQENEDDYLKVDYLYDLQDAYDDTAQTKQKFLAIDEGIQLAEKTQYRVEDFYSMKMKMLLASERFEEVKKLLTELESANPRIKPLTFEKLDLTVIKAVLAGYEGKLTESKKFFENAREILKSELDNNWQPAVYLLYWQAKIALHCKDFGEAQKIISEYLQVATQNSQKDSLPWIYLMMAKALSGLGNYGKAIDYVDQSIQLIEEKRRIGVAKLSIGVMEVLFEAYQLKIELEDIFNHPTESLQTSELLKSRWLQDKISNSRLTNKYEIDQADRQNILTCALKFLEKPSDPELNSELSNLESKTLLKNRRDLNEEEGLLKNLVDTNIESDTAIISYAFTEHSLIAFVYRKGEEIKALHLNLTEEDLNALAKTTQEKIKKFIFYRQTGKDLYDLLLRPLGITNIKNLIIIPDKSLWKMPFQAFSSDGKSFLIENTRISYVPSFSILLKQLTTPPPRRESFHVFANSVFDNYLLKYADSEANTLAQLYQVKPSLNATISDFKNKSDKFDILHFSMHAEFDAEPFSSFLAFNQRDSKGKFTVADMLNLRLKKQSLVFLASCSTNNVYSGEGLVSLSWAIMGAGATTVISSQWEANDKSTEQFSKGFYKYYQTGLPAAVSFQKAAIEMINSPNEKLNKPFYWAEFTLNGDYR